MIVVGSAVHQIWSLNKPALLSLCTWCWDKVSRVCRRVHVNNDVFQSTTSQPDFLCVAAQCPLACLKCGSGDRSCATHSFTCMRTWNVLSKSSAYESHSVMDLDLSKHFSLLDLFTNPSPYLCCADARYQASTRGEGVCFHACDDGAYVFLSVWLCAVCHCLCKHRWNIPAAMMKLTNCDSVYQRVQINSDTQLQSLSYWSIKIKLEVMLWQLNKVLGYLSVLNFCTSLWPDLCLCVRVPSYCQPKQCLYVGAIGGRVAFLINSDYFADFVAYVTWHVVCMDTHMNRCT